MKKIMGLLLIMGLMVSFGGCGGDKDIPTDSDSPMGYQGQTLEVYEGEDRFGNKIEYQFYHNGNEKVKHGYYKVFDGGGNIAIEGEYKEGERWSGEFEYVVEWDYDEEKWVETEKKEVDDEIFRGRFIYSAGKKDGTAVLYYENGEIYGEINYKDGILHGKYIFITRMDR